jgi:hypothetical protein
MRGVLKVTMNLSQSRLLSIASLAVLGGSAQAQVINSFDTLTSIAKPVTTYSQATGNLTNLIGAVSGSGNKITFSSSIAGQYPTAIFANTAGYSAAGKGGIAITVTNVGTSDVTFNIALTDTAGVKYDAPVTVASGVTETLRLDTSGGTVDPISYGVQVLPNPFSGMRTLKGYGTPNLASLKQISIYQRGPAAGGTLVVDDLKILPAFDLIAHMTGIVDDLGQNAKVTYPGKTTNAAALVTNRIAERAELDANPSLPGRNLYGGDATAASLTATGYFHTQKVGNKWWLVTPDGKPFWSVGFCAAVSDNPTIIQGRSAMFANLPASSPFYGTAANVIKGPQPTGAKTFDYFAYNLSRKYGSDYQTEYVQTTLDRARSWGFNTLGGFTDPEFKSNGRVPYCGTFGIEGTFPRISTGNDYWQALPDPYSTEWRTAVTNSVTKAQAAATATDPYLIGWFVDNELTWIGKGTSGPTYQYALVYSVARMTWDGSAAKRAFVRSLTAKYPTIADLNAAWGTSFGSFSALNSGFELDTTPTAALTTDMSNYMLSFMRQYFSIIRNSLRAADPNHMYMGCRFAKNNTTTWYTPETLKAASEYCNVMSMNFYSSSVKPADWTFLADYNVPMIIGEFHFGATDRGLFNPGLIPVASAAERGASYEAYIESAARNASIVGAHYFQYLDQPILGRPMDGQNANIGLIDIADQPYTEMVNAARNANAQIYTWHKA